MSLRHSLPCRARSQASQPWSAIPPPTRAATPASVRGKRSEEHTSELQSLRHLVCRLLLEKKKKKKEATSSITQKQYVKACTSSLRRACISTLMQHSLPDPLPAALHPSADTATAEY